MCVLANQANKQNKMIVSPNITETEINYKIDINKFCLIMKFCKISPTLFQKKFQYTPHSMLATLHPFLVKIFNDTMEYNIANRLRS